MYDSIVSWNGFLRDRARDGDDLTSRLWIGLEARQATVRRRTGPAATCSELCATTGFSREAAKRGRTSPPSTESRSAVILETPVVIGSNLSKTDEMGLSVQKAKAASTARRR
jgi:hypothetical protein